MAYDLGRRPQRLFNFARPTVRIPDDVRQSVVFVGHEADEASGGFKPVGTAFLVAYKDSVYLVTAQHVALDLGRDPFVMRFNKTDGTATNMAVDPIEHNLRWYEHPDPDVDLAVIDFNFDMQATGHDSTCVPETIFAGKEVAESVGIGIGDICYAVGLFSLMAGRRRNLPVVHTGNIALMPTDERIPIEDWRAPVSSRGVRFVEGYLVSLHNLPGLSGSPVFVRPIMRFELQDTAESHAIMPYERVFLLGVWTGSWDARVGPQGLSSRQGSASIGMGTVVPTQKLIELLDSDALQRQRAEWNAFAAQQRAAKID